jgi:hypothetical protein
MHLFGHFAADSASFVCNKVILFRKISKKARFSANNACQFRSHRCGLFASLRAVRIAAGYSHRCGLLASLLTTLQRCSQLRSARLAACNLPCGGGQLHV